MFPGRDGSPSGRAELLAYDAPDVGGSERFFDERNAGLVEKGADAAAQVVAGHHDEPVGKVGIEVSCSRR